MIHKTIKIACLSCHHLNNLKASEWLKLDTKKLLCVSCQNELLPFLYQPFLELLPEHFVHPLDRQMLEALQKIPGIDSVLRGLLRHSIELSMRLHHEGSFLKVSNKQFKSLEEKLKKACEILDISPLPELFVVQDIRVNAYTFGVEKCSIAITTGALELLNSEEILAILAHELGHIKANHVLYKMASRILANIASSMAQKTLGLSGLMLYPIQLALLRWDRASELSSDRAALLVVKDPHIVLSLLMKLAGGSNIFKSELNLEAFIEQAESYEKIQEEGPLGKYITLMNDMFQTHPLPIWRAKEIIDWVQSGEYFKLLQGHYAKNEPAIKNNNDSLEKTLKDIRSWYDKNFN
jgi:Zn-dependent protease with chaperone function